MDKKFEALEAIFNPRAVAVIGASDNLGKLGSHVMRSLIEGKYPGRIYPINPGREEIFGIKTHPSITKISDGIDLSILVLPSEQVPQILRQCYEKGVRGIILITAGFKEIEDRRGKVLQKEITDLANQFGIKIIGPNTFGVVNLHLPLNASFTPEFSHVQKGRISFLSQSGGMSHLIAFLSLKERVGLSKIVGLGNRCNVDFWDMVEYLEEDPETDVIAIYLEGIDDPRRLMEVSKRVDRKKPIIAYKVGLSNLSDRASQFHTGSLAGNYKIYEGALRQGRILTVRSSEELLDTAKALALCPLPEGKRVAVLSGQAGPGMAVCDICELGGLRISPFSRETQKKVNQLLPPLAIRTNPVDMGPAWYDSEAIKGIVQTVMEDEDIDALVVCIMFASANRSSVGRLTDLFCERSIKKPILCSLSAPAGIWDDEIKRLEESKIPNYPTPERAGRALVNLVRFKAIRSNLKIPAGKD